MLATEHPLPRATLRPGAPPVAWSPSAAARRLEAAKARVPAVRAASGKRVWDLMVNHAPIPSSFYATPKAVPSRAYHKLREIQLSCSLPSTPRCTVHLCENPGGFVCATRDALDPDARGAWEWHAVSLGGPDAPAPAWDLLPVAAGTLHTRALSPSRPAYVPTSDLEDCDVCQLACRDGLAARVGGRADLVTADGAVDMDHGGDLEAQHLPLLRAETAAAVRCLRPGGVFVVKCFELLTRPSQAWLAWLTLRFASVSVIKPTASRATNSERYVVARGYAPPPADDEDQRLLWTDQVVLADGWQTTVQTTMDRLADEQTKSLHALFARCGHG